jgi:hypothetical protein
MELLTKQLREPAGAGHGVFGFCGQVLFLQATETFFDGSSGRFLDGLENLLLSDARKIIGGGWLPPMGSAYETIDLSPQ